MRTSASFSSQWSHWWVILSIATALCVQAPLRAQGTDSLTREQLFEKAFGAPAPKLPKRLHALVRLDGQEQPGEIELRFSDDRTRFSVPVQAILQTISRRIDTAAVAEIQRSAVNGYITDTLLTRAGVDATFNSGSFSLNLRTNPRIRKQEEVYISGKPLQSTSDIPPSKFSGYFNIYLQQMFRSYSASGSSADTSLPEDFLETYIHSLNNQRVQPFSGSTDFAVRVLPVVLEGRVAMNTGREIPVARQNLRLVYDNRKLATRFSVGDNLYRIEGFQRFIKGAGLAISREFMMNPSEVAYPVSQEILYLEEPSEVEVVVNGVTVRKLSLSAGTHHLKNFASTFGENDVELILKDFYGRTQTRRFSFFHDLNMLGKGKYDFSCFVGVPSEVVSWAYEYDLSGPLVSGFVTYGLDNRINLGGNAQYYHSNGLLGFQGAYATKWGVTSADLAASVFDHRTAGAAAKLAHRIQRPQTRNKAEGFSAHGSVELFSSRFSEVTDTSATEDRRFLLTGAFDKQLSSSVSAGIGGEMSATRTGQTPFMVSAHASVRPARGLSIRARVTYQRDLAGNEYPAVSIKGVWSLIANKHSISAGEHLQRSKSAVGSSDEDASWLNYTNLAWNYRSSYALSDYFSSSAGVVLDPFTSTINARVGYTSGYGTAEVTYANTSPASQSAMPFSQHYATLDLSTALVFAVDHIGISRPVMNSFFLVSGRRGDRIPINPGFDGNQGMVRGAFPGVIPEISAYSQRSFRVDSPDFSAVSGGDKAWYRVFTGYKTAHVIAFESQQNTMVYATLQLPGGAPAAQRSVTVKNNSDTTETPVSTFTSSTGKLTFPAIAGATYRITLQSGSEDGRFYEVSVPKNTEDYHRAGVLKMP